MENGFPLRQIQLRAITMPPEPKLHRFDNGVRLATIAMPHMQSVSVGLWADAGSRHERPDEHGMAHLVEHMIFKGTPTRSAVQICREIESLGSNIDGYTVEDHTAYQAKAPASEFAKLFDVLSDFYLLPTMDPGDLESEKQIIHEEIAMVRDQPSQWLEDLISEATWGEHHPLGRSITGTDDSLDSFDREDLLSFFRRAYCGENTVISVAGNIDPAQVVDIVGTRFQNLHSGAPVPFAAAIDPLPEHHFAQEEDLEQTHVALSFEGVDRHDPMRYAIKLLSVILGESMSSRLFQELREKRALCYEVQSDVVSFDDAGLLQIFLALSPENLEEALSSISRIANQLLKKGVTEVELDAAKSYLVGQSRISLESTTAQMLWAGECALFYDNIKDPEDVHSKLEAVTLADIHAATRWLFNPMSFSSALVGPTESEAVFESWRRAMF